MRWVNKRLAAVCLGALVVVYAIVAFTVPTSYWLSLFGNTVQAGLQLLCVVAMLLNLRNARGRARFFWWAMAGGAGLWLLGQMQWIYYESIRQTQPPNPSVLDIVVFLHVVPLVGATALQPHADVQRGEAHLRLGYWDFALLTIWWLFLFGYVVFPYQYIEQNDQIFGSHFNFLYATQNITLILALGMLWMRTRLTWKPVYGLLLLSGSSYALSSLLINIHIDANKYYTGHPDDIPLVFSMAALAFAGLWANDSDLKAERALMSLPVQIRAHTLLAMAAVLSMPFFALTPVLMQQWESPIGRFRTLLTFFAMVAFLVILFCKQWFSDRKLGELVLRSEQQYEDLQRLQGQIVQAEKLASIGKLVSGAAHELHTPLAAITDSADTLASRPVLDDQQHGYAEKIAEQARRTQHLVTNLMAFATHAPLQRSDVDLNNITQKALMLHQLNAVKRSIETIAQLDPELPRVSGDEAQLLQVFMHILNNAVDAVSGPEQEGHACILIRTEADHGKVRWICSDTGHGIEHPDRIFDPFYTTKPVGKGTGLGLSACYGIVREHGGTIHCHNRPEGGATFVIELTAPMDEPKSATPQVTAR